MKNWIYGAAIIVIIVSVVYNFMGGLDPEAYREEVMEARADTDRFMRFSEESPFRSGGVTFDSLHYYEPDLTYRIPARFKPVEEREILSLGTSDGKKEDYLTYGYAEFTLDGQSLKLLILENIDEEKLFIPFGDATSADETYGAGRYLDVEHGGSGTVLVDFNYAYNPYCAYVESFSCPLPPPQNLLPVAIRAGEKNYY